MALPGPSKKPTIQKKLQGTYRPDRAAKREPQPQLGVPKPPTYLTATEKRFYRELAKQTDEMGILTLADGRAMELASIEYGIVRKAHDHISEHGISYVSQSMSGSKERKPMPEVNTGARARKELRMWLTEFGMTPSSRSRIEVPQTAAEEDEFEKLFGGSETVNRARKAG